MWLASDQDSAIDIVDVFQDPSVSVIAIHMYVYMATSEKRSTKQTCYTHAKLILIKILMFSQGRDNKEMPFNYSISYHHCNVSTIFECGAESGINYLLTASLIEVI